MNISLFLLEIFRLIDGTRNLVAYGLALTLLASAYWHIERPMQTEEWMSKPSGNRCVGVLLLLTAVPYAVSRGVRWNPTGSTSRLWHRVSAKGIRSKP
jgi:hypothetical protein